MVWKRFSLFSAVVCACFAVSYTPVWAADNAACALVVEKPGVIEYPRNERGDTSSLVVPPRNVYEFVLDRVYWDGRLERVTLKSGVKAPRAQREVGFTWKGEPDAQSPVAIEMKTGAFVGRKRDFDVAFADDKHCLPALVHVHVDIDYEKLVAVAPTAQRTTNAYVSNENGAALRGEFANEFPFLHVARMVHAIYERSDYAFGGGKVRNIAPALTKTAGLGATHMSGALTGSDISAQLRVGLIKVSDPRIYAGVGYIARVSQDETATILHSFGFGAEKLSDVENRLSWHASAWSYPSMRGAYTYPAAFGVLAGRKVPVRFGELDYDGGVTWTFTPSGLYVDAGVRGVEGSADGKFIGSNYRREGTYAAVGWYFFAPF